MNSPRKSEQESHIQRLLLQAVAFLQSYLPLANTHATDFIVQNLWDVYLPKKIQTELLNLPREDLIRLPVSGQNDPHHVPTPHDISESPFWKHADISSFLSEAQSNTLERLDVLTSFEDLCQKIGLQYRSSTVSEFMNEKKTHEVDIMGDVCAALASWHSIKLVIDVGSGKGYLGTCLAYQHSLSVLAIDSTKSNTAGAVKRARKLRKQWDGLLHNSRASQPVRQSRGDQSVDIVDRVENLTVNETDSITCAKKITDNSTYRDVEYAKQKRLASDVSEIKGDHQNLSSDLQGEISEVQFGTEFGNEESENDKDQKQRTGGSLRGIDRKCEKANFSLSSSLNDRFSSDVDGVISSTVVSKHDKITADDRKSGTSEKAGHGETDHPIIQQKSTFVPLTLFVTTKTDLDSVVKEAFPEFQSSETGSGKAELLLTGLHTCGNLSPSLIQLFVHSPQIQALCNVGCCYHLLEEEFDDAPVTDAVNTGFPMSKYLQEQKIKLGRNARNLASQSVYRMAESKELQGENFFPRALLQVIIQDVVGCTSDDHKGLRNLWQKSNSLLDYVQRAFQKLGFPSEKITPELIQEYVTKYSESKTKLAAFFQLRVALAPCIEAIVMLDRVCYLLEQEAVEEVHLVRLFDPLTSPRCFGLVAVKSSDS